MIETDIAGPVLAISFGANEVGRLFSRFYGGVSRCKTAGAKLRVTLECVRRRRPPCKLKFSGSPP